MKKNKAPIILINSIIGIISAVVSTVATYLIRIVLSHELGDELYGVNSIFISIISAILILELGMSTAMIIVLYQPVIDENYEKIKSILHFFKKFYRVFSLVLFVLGLIVSLFFLQYFVNTTIDIKIVRLYFLLYMIAVIFKYLWSYKSCLLYANKENSVISWITIGNTFLFTSLEVTLVLIFKKYWVYLLIYLLQNAFQNILTNIYVNKHYPFVRGKKVVNLSQKDKQEVLNIIRPMFVQRLANQIQDSSSVVVLGALGTSAIVVGYFSNYIMLVHACQTLFNQVSASFTTSYGNYSARTTDEKSRYEYYLTSRFFMTWVAIVFSCMYLCLIQPFISMFFGKEYCLDNIISFLLTIYVFIILNSSINLSIQNAVGAHKLDSKWMIAQAVLGVALSVALGVFIGTNGVVIGMLISLFAFTGILKGYKVVKVLFDKSGFDHLKLFGKEIVEFFIVVLCTYLFISYFVLLQGVIGFVIKAILSFVVSNLLMLLINLKSNKLGYIKRVITRFFKKNVRR